MHTELAGDELGNARDGPQIAGEAVRGGARKQQFGEPLEVLAGQAGCVAGRSPACERLGAACFPAGVPAVGAWRVTSSWRATSACETPAANNSAARRRRASSSLWSGNVIRVIHRG